MNDDALDFLSFIERVQQVEIPMLQRDYAQGRASRSSIAVRNRFVDALVQAISSDAPSTALDLDFVYGRVAPADGGARTPKLEPIDGQQRLTTLFLLHWYAACAAGEIYDFRRRLCAPSGGSRFTYLTRPSARELFDALVREPVPEPTWWVDEAHRPSAWLEDQPWFARSWLCDPTVQGCLTMLDVLHERLRGDRSVYRRLASHDSRPIEFRLLALERFDLGDDLYLKMNARGKPLTAFEVWKAEFERWAAALSESELPPPPGGKPWVQVLGARFDREWTDLLWAYPKDADPARPDAIAVPKVGAVGLDERFLHLVRAVALVERVVADDSTLPDQLQALRESPEPSFAELSALGCMQPGFVQVWTRLLDRLVEHGSPVFLARRDYLDERALFDRVLLAAGEREDDGLKLADWVRFYAWCAFLLAAPDALQPASFRTAFHEWTRLVANLVDNSDLDRAEAVVTALRGVERAAPYAADPELLTRVASGVLDFDGFNRLQREEERIKAGLLLRDARWRGLLEEAECHPYFRGDISFLLLFAGIRERWEATSTCGWTDAEDDELRARFQSWHAKASAIFPDATEVGPGFLWERAVLANGDYLLPRGYSWSLLGRTDRKASWKRLLRADVVVSAKETTAEERREIVRRTLADIDPDDVHGSLARIIAGGVKDVQSPDDWRELLVRDPRHIEYCAGRLLRWGDSDRVLVLRRERLSGYYTVLQLHDLWLRLEDRADMTPWERPTRPEVRGEAEPVELVLETTRCDVALRIAKPGAGLMLTLTGATDGLARPLDGLWQQAPDGTWCREVATIAEALSVVDEVAAILA
jgi:hypothetical protein